MAGALMSTTLVRIPLTNIPPVPNFMSEPALYDWSKLVHRWAIANNLSTVVAFTSVQFPILSKPAPSIKFSVNMIGVRTASVALWPVSAGTRIQKRYIVNVSWPVEDATTFPLVTNSANLGVQFAGCSVLATLQAKCAYTLLLHSTANNILTLSAQTVAGAKFARATAQFVNGKYMIHTSRWKWSS